MIHCENVWETYYKPKGSLQINDNNQTLNELSSFFFYPYAFLFFKIKNSLDNEIKIIKLRKKNSL